MNDELITQSDSQFEILGDGLLVRAPAKINLSLLVDGKRPDGFHEIETIMAKVDFFDELLIQEGKKTGIDLICSGPNWAPEGKENLVYQACQLLLDFCCTPADVKITLTKNIPAGSGLGSASSDAAATLLGLNRFLKVNVTKTKLHSLAAQLGSDVAFFLNKPLAFCTGKGEKIKKIDKNFDFLALLILPNVSVSTKRVYDNYQPNQSLYETFSTQIRGHLAENRVDLAAKMCANMLETSCFKLYQELAELKAKIQSLDIVPLSLTGSGSAMFVLIDRLQEAQSREYKNKLDKMTGCRSVIVRNCRW
jgi:4-diphosphocytidyl-2-C-methyl-D-erythritol kinase